MTELARKLQDGRATAKGLDFSLIEELGQRFAVQRAALPRNDEGQPVCPDCGALIPAKCWYCPPCRERAELEEKRERRTKDVVAEVEQSGNGFLTEGRMLGVLPAWEYARFDNPQWVDLVDPRIVKAAKAWDWSEGNLVLCGPTGCGKTSAVVALLWHQRELAIADVQADRKREHWTRWLFITGPELVVARRLHRLGQAEPEILRELLDHDLVVLDEVGHEDQRDGVVFEVLDQRYREEKLTILTTGLTPEQWVGRYGAAAWRRLTERGRVVDAHEVAR